jgi:CHASE2 domain-containing sensor protein
MTDYRFTTEELQALVAKGIRNIVSTEYSGEHVGFADVPADDADHARRLALCNVRNHEAKSVAVYELKSDGRKKLVRFYDWRDLTQEVSA